MSSHLLVLFFSFFFSYGTFSLLFPAVLIAICTSSLGWLFTSFICSFCLKYILCVSNSLSALSFIISPNDSNCLFQINILFRKSLFLTCSVYGFLKILFRTRFIFPRIPNNVESHILKLVFKFRSKLSMI